MKLRKLILAISPIALVTGTATLPLSACSTSTVPTVKSHSVVNALLNELVSPIGGNPYYRTSAYGDVEVHHFNGSPVGYINVDDYVSTLMQFEDIFGAETGNFESASADHKTIIKNKANDSTCTINFEEQKIVFSDYDKFLCMEKEYATNPLAVGAGGGEKYFVRASDGTLLHDSKYVSGGQYTIDLTKYNITVYWYDDHGYIPYDLYRNLLNSNPLTYMFYNGVNFYEVDTQNNNNTVNLYAKIKDEATILNEEYMEYCYNLLALTLDTRFGLQERPSRANPGTTVKYMPDGAYAALEPYKAGLTSLQPDLANDYMCQFFADNCDDGGHAGYSGLDMLCTRPHVRTRGPESQNTQDANQKLLEVRELYYAANPDDPVDPYDYWRKTGSIPEVNDNYLNLYGNDEDNPILYITFDAFNAIQDYSTSLEEMALSKVLYGKVAEDNYMLDTIRMTMYADKFIKDYNDTTAHPTHTGTKALKNIVLDISDNGGGTVYTEHFIASWLCGGIREKIWNPHTKSYAEYTIRADVNGDGEFTSADYLGEDMNVYCITSEMSFSCGNMLPCNLVDAAQKTGGTSTRTTANTKFIGCSSGGGACFVDGNMHVGLGNVFRSSSNYHMLKGSSTETNHVSVESGSQPNDWFIDVPCTTLESCYGYVNRAAINTEIRKA